MEHFKLFDAKGGGGDRPDQAGDQGTEYRTSLDTTRVRWWLVGDSFAGVEEIRQLRIIHTTKDN